jgi:hypothetical protein
MFYGLALVFAATLCAAQPSPEELAPLLAGLEAQPAAIERRVPLSTNDPTIAPLIDLQVFAPPAVPKQGTSCTVTLLNHTFGMNCDRIAHRSDSRRRHMQAMDLSMHRRLLPMFHRRMHLVGMSAIGQRSA